MSLFLTPTQPNQPSPLVGEAWLGFFMRLTWVKHLITPNINPQLAAITRKHPATIRV